MREEIGIYLNKEDFIKAKDVINEFGSLVLQSGNIGFYLMECGCRLRTIEHMGLNGLSVMLFSANDKPLIEDVVGVKDYE